jgi:O-antigen ligase
VQVVLGRFVLGCGLVQILDGIAYFFLPPILGGAQDTLRATWMIDPLGQDLPRFAGVFNNPNAVGGVMMATVTASVAHWHAVKSRHRKILMALSMASAVFFAIVADSRSETAATIVGCTTYALWKYRWRAVRVLAVIVVAAVLTLPFINKQYLNRGLDTATGRTEAWAFEVRAVKASPFIGYGFQVEGEIFQNRYWTNWQDFWDHGANTALHNGYMSTAIGLGIPALLLWLVAFMTPWVMLLRDETDAWNLKPLLCLVALPILLISFDESVIEVRAILGLLVWVSWAITAHYGQIVSSAQTMPRKSLKAEWIPIFRLPHAENFR